MPKTIDFQAEVKKSMEEAQQKQILKTGAKMIGFSNLSLNVVVVGKEEARVVVSSDGEGLGHIDASLDYDGIYDMGGLIPSTAEPYVRYQAMYLNLQGEFVTVGDPYRKVEKAVVQLLTTIFKRELMRGLGGENKSVDTSSE